MKLCEDCQHRTTFSDDSYCELSGRLCAIDDYDCVNHEKEKHDIQTGAQIN